MKIPSIEQIHAIACPRCGAAEGKPCKARDAFSRLLRAQVTDPREVYHADRMQKAGVR